MAADPFIALEKMKLARPDVSLLDLETPHINGVTLPRKLMAEDGIAHASRPIVTMASRVGGR